MEPAQAEEEDEERQKYQPRTPAKEDADGEKLLHPTAHSQTRRNFLPDRPFFIDGDLGWKPET
jgi:hypothetical protein